MIRRGPIFRLQSLLTLAILAVGLGSRAYDYHGCANRTAAAAAGATAHAGHAAAAPAGRASHAAPSDAVRSSHVHARSAARPSADAPAGSGHEPCTCLGDCHSGAQVTLPPVAAEAPTASELRREPGARVEDRVPSRRPAFLLPFANAPPLSFG